MIGVIKRVLLAGFATLLLSALVVPSFRSHIFFLNFVDEDDNIVIGNYVSEGKKLYKDVYTQHQPILFHLSAQIQNIVKPDNILMTVKRHREFMILWSVVWIFIITTRFGFQGFIISTIIELIKINLLGNLFLAESLVVYPLIYVLLYLLRLTVSKINWEVWFVVTLIWTMIFSLAPIWPMLGVLLMYLIYKSKNRRLTTSITLFVGILFFIYFIGSGLFRDYWNDAIFINYKYYIPLTTPVGLSESIFKAFFAPIVSLLSKESSTLIGFIQVLSLGLILEVAWLIIDKKYMRAISWVSILFLSNIRYIDPANTLYGAFHMLPWLSVLIFVNITEVSRLLRLGRARLLTGILIIVLILWSSISVARTSLWDTRDQTTDFYINFSPSVDMAKAVEILSKDSEQTIWVEPVLYWPYWKTGAKQYSEMINYYGWMDKTQPMKESLDAQLSTELPTIVYAKTIDGIGKYLGEYVQFKRDGKLIDLYLRKDKLSEIGDEAKQQLDYYRFQIN